MRKWLLRALYIAPVLLIGGLAWSDYTATQGVVAAFTCQTTKICPGVAIYDATGTNQQGTSSNPFRTDPTGTTTQPVSAASLPLPTGASTSALQSTGNTSLASILTALGSPFQAGGSIGNTSFAVTNTGTFATQATLQASATTAIGKVDPNTIATWGLMAGTAPGTAPTNTMVTGGKYNTAAPTPSNGQTLPFQLDSAGRLIVNVGAGGGSGGTSSSFSSTFPGTGTAVGASDGTNMQPLLVDGSGNLKVVGTGVAQGSTTSGQTGSPVMGAVTTSAPSYTNAQSNLLSLNPAGQLRTTGTSYPDGAVPITASNTGTTAATTATLAASASGLKTYICWLSIRANATAAATANSTVTGTVTGTLNFTQWTAPNASGIGLTEMIFNPCIPSSATNTAIAVISAAPGTGGVVSVSAGGYQGT